MEEAERRWRSTSKTEKVRPADHVLFTFGFFHDLCPPLVDVFQGVVAANVWQGRRRPADHPLPGALLVPNAERRDEV